MPRAIEITLTATASVKKLSTGVAVLLGKTSNATLTIEAKVNVGFRVFR
ncbi:MAG: hypothetical protein AB4040_21665 [Synechococcus sp.]